MDTFFSIVIPTYNRADLIIETIETVLAQSYKQYEIIVVDNCSTDKTKEVLKKYIDEKKILYICHDKNYERGKSRNTGMENAKGDFLTFLDSDDFLYPECLADANSYIKSNPEIKIFQNKYELVDNDRKLIYKCEFPSLENQHKALCDGNFISCIGVFLQREVYKKYRFSLDEKMVGSEDYEIWFKILADYKFGRIDKVNSGVRHHENRSVIGTRIYDNLEYQRLAINNMILSDEKMKEKYSKYLERFNTWCRLKVVLFKRKERKNWDSFKLLTKSIFEDLTIIFTLRFWKILYNFIK